MLSQKSEDTIILALASIDAVEKSTSHSNCCYFVAIATFLWLLLRSSLALPCSVVLKYCSQLWPLLIDPAYPDMLHVSIGLSFSSVLKQCICRLFKCCLFAILCIFSFWDSDFLKSSHSIVPISTPFSYSPTTCLSVLYSGEFLILSFNSLIFSSPVCNI